MDQNLIQSIQSLSQQLQRIDGQLYRDAGANIIPSFSQVYDLTTATTKEKPLETVQFDFKSMVFTDGTDNDTYIYAILGRRNGAKIPAKFKNNGSYVSDFQTTEVSLYSPAQPGKSITINLYRDAIVTTGQTVQSGTVAVANPTAFTVVTQTLVGPGAISILAQNTARKESALINNTGNTLYLGGSTVTATGTTKGFPWNDGDIFIYKNSAELFAWAGTFSGDITKFEET